LNQNAAPYISAQNIRMVCAEKRHFLGPFTAKIVSGYLDALVVLWSLAERP